MGFDYCNFNQYKLIYSRRIQFYPKLYMLGRYTTIFINITCGLRTCSHEFGESTGEGDGEINCVSACKTKHSPVIPSYTHRKKYNDINIRSSVSDKPINIKQDQAYEIALDYLINVQLFIPHIKNILTRTSYPISLIQMYKFRDDIIKFNLIYNLYRAMSAIMEYLNYPIRYQEFWSSNVIIASYQTVSVRYPPLMIFMQINMMFILNENNTQFRKLPKDILRYILVPMIWYNRETLPRDINVVIKRRGG